MPTRPTIIRVVSQWCCTVECNATQRKSPAYTTGANTQKHLLPALAGTASPPGRGLVMHYASASLCVSHYTHSFSSLHALLTTDGWPRSTHNNNRGGATQPSSVRPSAALLLLVCWQQCSNACVAGRPTNTRRQQLESETRHWLVWPLLLHKETQNKQMGRRQMVSVGQQLRVTPIPPHTHPVSQNRPPKGQLSKAATIAACDCRPSTCPKIPKKGTCTKQ